MSNLSLDPLLTGGAATAANLFVDVISTTSSAAQVFTVPPGSRIKKFRFKILSLSTETFAFAVSTDGTNYTAALGTNNLQNMTTNLAVTSAALGNGTYELKFPVPFQKFKFTKSAAVDTGVVAVGALLVPMA